MVREGESEGEGESERGRESREDKVSPVSTCQ